MPELPRQKRERFASEYRLGLYDAGILSATRAMADFYEAVAKQCGSPKLAANWVQVELVGRLNRHELNIENSPVSPRALSALIERIVDNSISGKIAKQVFEAMWEGEGSADEIIEARGLKQVSDSGELEAMVDDIIAANSTQVEQYLAADDAKRKKLLGFFVGQIMKISKGQANPQMGNKVLSEKRI